MLSVFSLARSRSGEPLPIGNMNLFVELSCVGFHVHACAALSVSNLCLTVANETEFRF